MSRHSCIMAAACLLVAGGARAGDPPAQAPGAGDGSAAAAVVWAELTLDQALAEAAKTGKRIMVNVHADHCGQCQQMMIDVWNTPAGAALADGLIPIRIDSTSPEGAVLQRRYPVTGLPTVIFIGPDGKEVDRVSGYEARPKFLAEAEPIKDGLDPLPDMEDALAAHPDSLSLMLPILERYLNRMREADAESLLARVLMRDPENRAAQAERALMQMARYQAFVRGDRLKSAEYWRQTLDRFPSASTSAPAVKGTLEAAIAQSRVPEWKEWICGILEKEPQNARLQYGVAMAAHQAGLHDARFAAAARRARALGFGSEKLDTIAVELEEGAAPTPAPTPGSPPSPSPAPAPTRPHGTAPPPAGGK